MVFLILGNSLGLYYYAELMSCRLSVLEPKHKLLLTIKKVTNTIRRVFGENGARKALL